MSSILLNQKISKRSLTLNKSFVLSLSFHTLLIFGVTFTTFYKLPLIENSPIINVKFANSSQDFLVMLVNHRQKFQILINLKTA